VVNPTNFVLLVDTKTQNLTEMDEDKILPKK